MALDRSRSRTRTRAEPRARAPASAKRVVLRKRVSPATQAFWAELERNPRRCPPGIEELALGHVTVVCSEIDALAGLRWARKRPTWRDAAPAVTIDGVP